MPAQPVDLEKLGAFAPDLMALTDDIVFGQIWERPGLSKRDRSLVTVATLVALYRTEQMGGHMRRAIANGLTLDELKEAITHIAFYAGWPTAITGMNIARELFENEG